MTYKEKLRASKDWKKRALIIDLYHALKNVQETRWRLAQTARYFGISIGYVSESINLVEHLPLVKDCATRKQALNRLKRGN